MEKFLRNINDIGYVQRTGIRYLIPCLFLLLFFVTACNDVDGTQYSAENSVNNIIETEGNTSYVIPLEETNKVEDTEERFIESVDTKNILSENSVSIVMVGDILLHDSVESNCRVEGGKYNYSNIFKNIKNDIALADISIVNQEVIIGGSELMVTGYPSFNAPYEISDELVNTGFDVILHATNHALDRNSRGIINCLNNWREKYPDISVVGINASEEDRNTICIREINGIKVAILNYTYGTNGVKMPSDMPYAVNILDEDSVITDIKLANEQADFTIVCPHWGIEYSLEPSSEQIKWSKLFAENGADLIIGTHPHVIQPIDWIEVTETGNKCLVYYSLGNFVNWTAGNGNGVANRMIGGMAEVTIQRDELGNVVIADYGVEPLVCHVTKKRGGITVYRLDEYTDELAKSNEIVNQDNSFSLQYCNSLCKDIWGDTVK